VLVALPEQMAVSLCAVTRHRTTPGLSRYCRCMHRCVVHVPVTGIWSLATCISGNSSWVLQLRKLNTENTWKLPKDYLCCPTSNALKWFLKVIGVLQHFLFRAQLSP